MSVTSGNALNMPSRGGGTGPAFALTQPQVDGIIAGPVRHSTVVIAAYDTVGKAGADVICSASNARAQIQAVLDSMRGRVGRVFFMAGTYNLDAALIVDTSWITLEGENFGKWGKYNGSGGFANWPRASAPNPGGALFVQQTSGQGAFRVGTNYFDNDTRHKSINFMKLSMYGPTGTNIAIRDDVMTDVSRVAGCFIQGFAAGIDLRWDNPLVYDNNIQDTNGDAAVSQTGPGAIRIRGVRGQVYGNVIFQVGGIGIWTGSHGSCVFGNIVGGTNSHNVMVTCAKIKVYGNDLSGPGSKGQASTHNVLVANYPDSGSAQNIINNIPAYNCVIANNTCSMVVEDASKFPQNKTGSCIRIGGPGASFGGNSDYNVISGNTCTSSVDAIAADIHAIQLTLAADYNAITGNVIRGPWNAGSTKKIDLGTGANNLATGNVGTTL